MPALSSFVMTNMVYEKMTKPIDFKDIQKSFLLVMSPINAQKTISFLKSIKKEKIKLIKAKIHIQTRNKKYVVYFEKANKSHTKLNINGRTYSLPNKGKIDNILGFQNAKATEPSHLVFTKAFALDPNGTGGIIGIIWGLSNWMRAAFDRNETWQERQAYCIKDKLQRFEALRSACEQELGQGVAFEETRTFEYFGSEPILPPEQRGLDQAKCLHEMRPLFQEECNMPEQEYPSQPMRAFCNHVIELVGCHNRFRNSPEAQESSTIDEVAR